MTDDKPWLSLPDEEPPERGLAELMAAARVKAEVMAHPPWWRRLLDAVRRPPVLALATVIVLIGGVIVVGRHPDEVQTAAPVQSPAPPPVVAPGTAPATTETAKPSASEGEATAMPPQIVAPMPPPKHVTKKPPARAPETKAKLEEDSAPRGDAVAPRGGTVGGAKALELAAPDNAEDARPQQAPVQQAPLEQATKAPADPLARCRAAAANKDCTGAKACAQAVEKTAPAYYRANVDKDAALKSCL